MSIYIARNTDSAAIKAPSLQAVGSAGNRGLPPVAPLSATWACYPDTLAVDYYDLLGYGDASFGGTNYYMAATLGTAGGPFWNLGVEGDWTGPQVVSNRWYYQGFRIRKFAGNWDASYFYDLQTMGVINANPVDPGTFNAPGANHSFTMGDAPWPTIAGTENWNGYLSGFKVWTAFLSQEELWAEARSPFPVLPKYFGALWACLPMRMAGDYSRRTAKTRSGRQWTVQSAVAGVVTSGKLTAPLHRKNALWHANALDAGLILPSSGSSYVNVERSIRGMERGIAAGGF